MLLNGSLMTWLCSDRDGLRDPSGPAQESRVTIEVETRPGTTTIVIKGELDLVTMPFLAARLALATRDRPGRLAIVSAEVVHDAIRAGTSGA